MIRPRTLGELRSKRSTEPLIIILASDNAELARSAAEALGKIRDAGAIRPPSTHLRVSQ
jgi:HEAT repeat protein